MGLATTLAISAQSFLRDYWILPQQQVAEMALSTLDMVWLIPTECYLLAEIIERGVRDSGTG